MSIIRAREHLTRFGVEERVQEFNVSSATVPLAAQALSVLPARIAKTLSFIVGERVVLIVVAGDARIDNAAYKAFFHTKARMVPPEEAGDRIGHEIGGICPFGIQSGVEVFLDVSLQRFDTVFPAAGSDSSAIELSCAELFDISAARQWIDVCRDWRLPLSDSEPER